MSAEEDIINPLREIFANIKEPESRWLTVYLGENKVEYECHECECVEPRKRKYCPDCGSRMVNYEE